MLDLTFLVSLFFLEFWFSLPRLGQTSVRSTPKAAPSLESKGSKGASCSSLLCFFFFFFFFFLMLFPCLSLLWRSSQYPYLPLAISPRFPHPFFNVLCVLSQSPPRNQRSERTKPHYRKLIQVLPLFSLPFFFLFFFFFLPFFLDSCPPFELCLLLQVLT